jgi:hypothetical protein
MTSSDIVAIFATVISICALMVTFLSYRRDRNKSNQDLIFQEKINAYKDLIFHANNIFESFFDLIDQVQDHEGTKKAWVKYFEKESDNFDELVTDFQDAIFRSIPIIPNKIYSELIAFGLESRHFVTSAFNGNAKLTIKAHENLEISLRKIISLIREDLTVDKLNVNLSKRLK